MTAVLARTDLSTSRPRTAFRDDIQGLRGLAVLLVVAFHADWHTPGGFVGVDVFFVLSGFLIGGLLLAETERTGRVALGTFFARRVRRLLPALAVLTSVTLVAALFVIGVGPQLDTTGRTGAAVSLFSANLYLITEAGYFAPAAERNPLLHTWSLSVEEQFYLFFPLLFVAAAAVWRRGRGLVTPRTTVTTLTVLVVGVSLWLSWGLTGGALDLSDPGVGGEPRLAFYAPFTRAWEFAAGAMLAFVTARGGLTLRRPGVTGLLGLALIAVAAFGFDGATPFPGLAALIPVTGTLLLLVAGASPGATASLLSTRPLVAIGDLSYSWYLWHWPAIVFAVWLWPDVPHAVSLAAVGSLMPAALSYHLVEQPLRRNRTIVGRRAVTLAAVCIAVPAVLGIAVVVINNHAMAIIQDASAQEAQQDVPVGVDNPRPREPDGSLAGDADDAAEPSCPESLAACDATPRGDGLVDVVLVGDSHAGALEPGLEHATSELGLELISIVEAGCAFLQGSSANLNCIGWQQEALETILELEPRVVVITGYTTGRVTRINSGREVEDYFIYSRDEKRAESDDEALGFYADGIEEAVRALTEHDIAVLIVSTVPDFDRDPLADQSAVDALTGSPLNGETIPVEAAVERNAKVLEIERAIAAEYGLVTVVDPIPILCDGDCAQVRGRTQLYSDTDHLAAAGARRLAAGIVLDLLALLERAR